MARVTSHALSTVHQVVTDCLTNQPLEQWQRMRRVYQSCRSSRRDRQATPDHTPDPTIHTHHILLLTAADCQQTS